MRFENLVPEVRRYMRSEIEDDIRNLKLWQSKRLTPAGLTAFPTMLLQAADSGDANTLVAQLKAGRSELFKTSQERNGKQIKVASDAPDTLGENEFNRYYCRAVCLYSIERAPYAEVEVYRAKPVLNPRSRSELLIGKRFKGVELLADLRLVS